MSARPASREATAARQRFVLKLAAAALASFTVSLVAAVVLPDVFSDPRASAVANMTLWAIVPVMFGTMAASLPSSWRAWAGSTLVTSAAWAAASALSAAFLTEAFAGANSQVFTLVFGITFLPMTFFVVLVGVVVRMKRLSGR